MQFFKSKAQLREKRQERGEARFVNMKARPVQPEDVEIDPYGNIYEIYPEQAGIFRFDKADADTILFTPEFYVLRVIADGFDPNCARIQEISVLHFREDKFVDQFYTVVAQTKDSAGERSAVNQLARYMDETIPVVVFYAGLDCWLLWNAYVAGERCSSIKYIDTLDISLKLWPTGHSRYLEDLRRIMELPTYTNVSKAVDGALAIANIYMKERDILWERMAYDNELSREFAHPQRPVRLVEPESFYFARRGTVLDRMKRDDEAIQFYGMAIDNDPSYLEETERYAILLRRKKGVAAELPIVQAALDYSMRIGNPQYIDLFRHRMKYIKKHLK